MIPTLLTSQLEHIDHNQLRWSLNLVPDCREPILDSECHGQITLIPSIHAAIFVPQDGVSPQSAACNHYARIEPVRWMNPWCKTRRHDQCPTTMPGSRPPTHVRVRTGQSRSNSINRTNASRVVEFHQRILTVHVWNPCSTPFIGVVALPCYSLPLLCGLSRCSG